VNFYDDFGGWPMLFGIIIAAALVLALCYWVGWL
jgi:hypothetical protein